MEEREEGGRRKEEREEGGKGAEEAKRHIAPLLHPPFLPFLPSPPLLRSK